jgi:hypothetical protein
MQQQAVQVQLQQPLQQPLQGQQSLNPLGKQLQLCQQQPPRLGRYRQGCCSAASWLLWVLLLVALAAAELRLVLHLAVCRAGWAQASPSWEHCLAQQLLAMLLLQRLAQGYPLACTLAHLVCWVLEGPQALLTASWRQHWGILLLLVAASTLACSLQLVWVPCCRVACWLREEWQVTAS